MRVRGGNVELCLRRTLEECTQEEERSQGATPTRQQLEMLTRALPELTPSQEEEEEFYYLLNFERVPKSLLGNRLVILSKRHRVRTLFHHLRHIQNK